jgi:4-hydroxy-4-methyl-2-oxoglutarate aldolase
MSNARPALDLDQIAAQTYEAVYSDVCDAAGLRQQTPEPGARLLAGRLRCWSASRAPP